MAITQVSMTATESQGDKTMMLKSTGKPSIISILVRFNISDKRVLNFWLLELFGVVSFFLCLWVTKNLPNIHNVTQQPSDAVNSSYAVGSTIGSDIEHLTRSSYATNVSLDVWFALAAIAAFDAFFIVFNFNRLLIDHFHYSISLRMTLVASIVALYVWFWIKDSRSFVSNHPLLSALPALAFNTLFGYMLDAFKKPMPQGVASYRPGTIQQYSQTLALFDVSWSRAVFLASTTGGFGLALSVVIPPSWSSTVPIFLGLFEAVFLNIMKTGRTARYIVLASPVLQSTICAHWGLKPLATSSSLSLELWVFLSIILAGRMVLDLYLRTVFSDLAEFHWARKNVLVSTTKIAYVCLGLLIVEMLGLRVVAYIKPIIVVTFFGLGNCGFLAPAAYIVVFDKIKTIRR